MCAARGDEFYCSHQCLHHVWSLQSEALHCLEDIQDAFCLHPLQDCTQCTEGPCAPSTGTVKSRHIKENLINVNIFSAVNMQNKTYTSEALL